MATFPQKTQLPTSITSRSNLPLSDKHQTTTNFMETGVAKFMELVPKSGIDLDMRCFARFDTMKKPTQGDVDVNLRAYFVPCRTIQKNFNEIIDEIPVNSLGQVYSISEVDTIRNARFADVLLNPDYGYTTLTEQINIRDIDLGGALDYTLGDSDDIVIPDSNSQDTYLAYNFTAKGARVYKLLTQLGYAVDFNPKNAYYRDDYKSVLPLRALVKVFLDHYYPSQYILSDEYNTVSEFLNFDKTTYGQEFDLWVDEEILHIVFEFIDKVCYNNDYFVSAWDNPNSPNAGTSTSYYNMTDINGANGGNITEVKVDPANMSGAPIITSTSNNGTLNNISQYMLTALKSVSDFLTRHKISGARVIDRYLAEWGVVLPDANLNRSVYIDEFKQNVIFGDVTSTADTTGANLGSYAGKGIIPERNAHFSYETEEFGYFLIMSTCVPVVGYYQGEDRLINHISPLDFYRSTFDNLGVQAIATKELYVPMNTLRQYGSLETLEEPEGVNINRAIFGFIPRYAEYKVGKDRLTGDFRLGSRNTELDAWHLFRNMDYIFEGREYRDVKHDINFIRGFDSEQYNRIFNYMGDGNDKIKISYYFNYNLSFPGKKLYDTYEFTDADKAQKVTVDVGGSKAN